MLRHPTRTLTAAQANRLRGRVYLFSPSKGRVVRTYPLGNTSPVAVASAAGRIWVAVS